MEIRTIETVVQEQREEFLNNLSKSFCYRKEEELINIDSNLAQVVIGVRRSGKSTLCINVIKKSKRKFAYINFDDERFANIKQEDLNDILECLYKVYGGFSNIFMDEVQNVEGWHLFVNRLLRQGMHILVTGSNAKLLSGELATYLTGRNMQIELYPFSFSEYCDYMKISKSSSTTREKGLLRAGFDSYLHDGGFPELLNEKRKQAYINTLVNSILSNDIESRYSVRYKATFEKMTNHLLNNAPTLINYKEMQKLFGFTDHTAENYVKYLKNAYLINSLHKYSTKSKIRIRDEKIYPIDVALMNNREDSFKGENIGWRLETIIYIELLRRYKPQELDIYYYNNNSGEADFMICKGNTTKQIIQVSYDISNSKTLKREIKGLLLASSATSCTNIVLITDNEDREIVEDGKIIKIIPAYSWLVEDGDNLI